MEDLKIGDVVVLNSGSPYLTVARIDEGFVSCIFWIEGNAETSAVFNLNPQLLTKVEKPKL